MRARSPVAVTSRVPRSRARRSTKSPPTECLAHDRRWVRRQRSPPPRPCPRAAPHGLPARGHGTRGVAQRVARDMAASGPLAAVISRIAWVQVRGVLAQRVVALVRPHIWQGPAWMRQEPAEPVGDHHDGALHPEPAVAGRADRPGPPPAVLAVEHGEARARTGLRCAVGRDPWRRDMRVGVREGVHDRGPQHGSRGGDPVCLAGHTGRWLGADWFVRWTGERSRVCLRGLGHLRYGACIVARRGSGGLQAGAFGRPDGDLGAGRQLDDGND
jgi:hypothetical protein